MSGRLRMIVCAALLAAVVPGCRWNTLFRRPGSEPAPILFSTLPTKDEAIAALNANTSRVRTLQTQGATVAVPGLPAISADLALERPLNLRFRAGTNWTGPELDLGSNQELFWFWAARNTPPQVLYARHDRFALSRARDVLPVEPVWLVEALGLVEIDPALASEPVSSGNGRIEIRSQMSTPQGEATRLVHLDEKHGWLMEHHLLDPQGRIKASARLSGHEYYPLDGVSLARRIDVQIPQAEMRFTLDVAKYTINLPFNDGQSLFQLPREQLGGNEFVDIADPNFIPVGMPAPAAAAPQQPAPRVSEAVQPQMPRYRGMPQWR
jgi:hypothetical protein